MQSTWLYTKGGGIEFGFTERKSIIWQGGFEPGPPDYKPTSTSYSRSILITNDN